MVTNATYLVNINQISEIFCENNVNKTLCRSSVSTRIKNNFNNTTFEYFLENIQQGRFYILQYRNWQVTGSCRDMGITVKLTDAITGEIFNRSWYYTNENCEAKQFYFPDLNNLMTTRFSLLDTPIQTKTNEDITRARLVYNPGAPSYNIVYVPPTGGGGGNITPPKKDPYIPAPTPAAPTQAGGFEDILAVLSNPIVLIGLGVGGYLIWRGSK